MAHYERKRYTIFHKSFDSVKTIQEPNNWKTVRKKMERNTNYHGLVITVSEELEFSGDTKDLLESLLDDYGINAEVQIVVYKLNDETDIEEIDFIGWLDFKTYKITDITFTIKLSTDPRLTVLKSKQTSKIELTRLTDIDENEIDLLKIGEIYLDGIQLFLKSELVSPNESLDSRTQAILAFDTETRFSPELNVLYKDDENVHSVFIEQVRIDNQIGVDSLFYGKNDIAKTIYVDAYANHFMRLEAVEGFNVSLKAVIRVYAVDVSEQYIFDREIIELFSTPSQNEWEGRMDFDVQDIQIDLAVNECAALEYVLTAAGPLGGAAQFVDRDANGDLILEEDIHRIVVKEDSVRDSTYSKCIRIHEAFERQAKILLGIDFKSNHIGRLDLGYPSDGELSSLVLLHGMYARGMNSSYEKFKELSVTFKDLYESLNAISPIGIEIKNDILRLEERSYFYRRDVEKQLTDVYDFEIEPDIKGFPSTIEVGFEKAGGYEDRQGLDEYNRKTEYNTILKTETSLKLISKIRSDGYGLETVRRENKNFDEDSSFDDDLWFVDAFKNSNETFLRVCKWAKRFAAVPKNIYAPETAINLWLSPINSIIRHGKFIKPYFLKYLSSKISFNSSDGNSNLITQLIGGNEYNQGEGIPVNDLDNAMHIGRLCSFKAPLLDYVYLSGETNGVYNFYNLYTFKINDINYKVHLESVELEGDVGTFKAKIVEQYE